MSFKEKLLGRKTKQEEEVADDWFSNKEEGGDMEEEEDPKCPCIRISQEEKARIQ